MSHQLLSITLVIDYEKSNLLGWFSNWSRLVGTRTQIWNYWRYSWIAILSRQKSQPRQRKYSLPRAQKPAENHQLSLQSQQNRQKSRLKKKKTCRASKKPPKTKENWRANTRAKLGKSHWKSEGKSRLASLLQKSQWSFDGENWQFTQVQRFIRKADDAKTNHWF